NGDLEQIDGRVIVGWYKEVGEGGGEGVSVSSPMSSGSRAVKLEAVGMNQWYSAQITQEVAVEGGRLYKVYGDVHAEELQDAVVEVQVAFYDANENYIDSHSVYYEEETSGYIHLE